MDVGGERNHTLLGLLDCDAGLEPTDRRKKVAASIRFAFRSKRQRLPDVDRAPKNRMFESGRHHADYLYCFSVELYFSSHHSWVAPETARPKTIAEDDSVISARLEFFGFEYAAVRRCDSQHWKEIGGGCEAEQTFRCLPLLGEVTADEVVGRHLLKNRILVVLVEEISG